MKMGNLCIFKILPILVFFLLKFSPLTLFFAFSSYATNTIKQGQVLRDGEKLISSDGSFELGFFSPSNSSLRYVGIWYSNISVDSVIWVANRDAPIRGKKGSLTIGNQGSLVVLDGIMTPVWSSNTTVFSNNYTAFLHNNGNLEIWGNNISLVPNFTCWQSFEHPTDTYLPGMRVLVNPTLGDNHMFKSWKSRNEPSIGNFSMGVDPKTAPQIVIWKGSNRVWRSGYWNGLVFTGVPSMAAFYNYGFKLSNPDSNGNMYFSYTPLNRSNKFKFVVTWDGFEKSFQFSEGGNEWILSQSEPSTDCDVYNKCGVYGICSLKGQPICNCFHGFVPKFWDQWQNKNWSGGCVRKTQLLCERNSSMIGKDGFWEVDNVKIPDFADLNLLAADQQTCRKQCSQNCSCTAYSYVREIGCMTWSGELIDIQRFSQGGNTMYIRLASSDLGENGKLSGPQIAAIVLSGPILLCILILLWKFGAKMKDSQDKRKNYDGLTIGLRRSRGYSTEMSGSQEMSGEGNLIAPDLQLFSYDIVASATNFFSEENKLGQGGFGPVYKGVLPGGEEIAVKKLSRKSGQGMEEFKNEIMLIAKLQHRNLVRILGCCTHGEEKMLLYEYMPNKSLDGFIFDSTKQGQLGWRKRVTIIEGIARGLLYLHRDARCKIIHRDLKASNILLDQEMNAKISDFGMARMFGGDQDLANTNRIVGTYGYMSPEYAMEGFFSEKSDVYSFGVLLLEVITGRRNAGFRTSEHMSLVEYAWNLWSEGKALELVDPSIVSSCLSNEISRFVHIALLCLQDSIVYRPIMSQVVLWLESDSVVLPIPKEPTLAYSSLRGFTDIDYQNGIHDNRSFNDLTITMMGGR